MNPLIHGTVESKESMECIKLMESSDSMESLESIDSMELMEHMESVEPIGICNKCFSVNPSCYDISLHAFAISTHLSFLRVIEYQVGIRFELNW